MEEWLELIRALAWPVVVVLAILLFRGPLTRLIDAIENFKLKAGNVEVEGSIASARRAIEKIRGSAPQLISADVISVTSAIGEIETASANEFAVLEALANAVRDEMIRKVPNATEAPPQVAPTLQDLGTRLVQSGQISGDVQSGIYVLADLRDDLIAQPSLASDAKFYASFRSLSESILQSLRSGPT